MNNKVNFHGIIGTVIFHGIIVLILLFMGFSTPLPLPEEQGILIAFGNTNNGLGNTQASIAKDVTPSKTKKTKPVAKRTNTPKAKTEKVLTQDFEDAPSIKSGKAKKKKKIKPKKKLSAKEIKARKERAEKRKQERIEKERIRKEQEKQRRLEAERIRKEKARQAKIANINKQAKSIFGKKTGNNSGNSGNTSGKGNMGKPQGSLDGNYNGTGTGNSGVSYSLSGRSATNIIKPATSFQKSGKVVVTIYVNKYGKVTRATAGARGTTTHDTKLHKLAEKAALKTTFNTDRKAAATQKGTITYIFIVK